MGSVRILLFLVDALGSRSWVQCALLALASTEPQRLLAPGKGIETYRPSSLKGPFPFAGNKVSQ